MATFCVYGVALFLVGRAPVNLYPLKTTEVSSGKCERRTQRDTTRFWCRTIKSSDGSFLIKSIEFQQLGVSNPAPHTKSILFSVGGCFGAPFSHSGTLTFVVERVLFVVYERRNNRRLVNSPLNRGFFAAQITRALPPPLLYLLMYPPRGLDSS